MFSSWETCHTTPHHVEYSGTPRKLYTRKEFMQTYQLQGTTTFNVVLLIPCTLIYLLKIIKNNGQYSKIYIKNKQSISLEVVVIKIIKLKAKIFPRVW